MFNIFKSKLIYARIFHFKIITMKNIICNHLYKLVYFFIFYLSIINSAHAQNLESAFSALKNNDLQTAFNIFNTLSENGNDVAQSTLATLYSEGIGTQKDQRKAIFWYTASAEQGNWISQHSLGEIYSSGSGVTKNNKKSYFWWWLACQNERGFQNLAEKCNSFKSLLTPQDREEVEIAAKKWHMKSAEISKSLAEETLSSSVDVSPLTLNEAYDELSKGNYSNAFQGFIKLANEGEKQAQASIGLMYKNGHGVQKNYSKAASWFRRAADQGQSFSQTELATLYYLGLGVPQDEKQAYFWYLLSSMDGDEESIKGRDILGRKLTNEQRSEVQELARGWKPKYEKYSNTYSQEGSSSPSSNDTKKLVVVPDGTGSGFRVTRDSFVTNNHVINGCSRLSVNGVPAQVRGNDARSDLAILNANLAGPITSIRSRRFSVGEQVAVAGYPLRGLLSGFNMTTGTLSSMSGMGGDTRLVQITAPVQPGNSGGPMLDSAGNLMGVVVSKLDVIKTSKITGDIAQNVNFAININVLRSFLDANSVDYDTATSDKTVPTTVIAEKAKGFTVLVECWK